MKVANVVGARPQFVKAGPVSRALEEAGVQELLIHTGQHYDPLLSDRIMEDIGLRRPDVNLGVGSGTHGFQTARILEGVESLLIDERVNAVIIYGDTNSTVATALASVKLQIPTAHVEAGLRSFNRLMPEEINRVVTDHVSDLLFAPTETAMSHLRREGLGPRARLTGDVMVDALHSIDFDAVELPRWARGDYYVATVHRPENSDNEETLRLVMSSLAGLDSPVHLLAHPRLSAGLKRISRTHFGPIVVHEPLPYAAMLATLRSCKGLFTDSGGLQKEAFILRVPCVTIRGETEWPETMAGSWNVLARPGDDFRVLTARRMSPIPENPFGDGEAGRRIVELLVNTVGLGPSV